MRRNYRMHANRVAAVRPGCFDSRQYERCMRRSRLRSAQQSSPESATKSRALADSVRELQAQVQAAQLATAATLQNEQERPARSRATLRRKPRSSTSE